MSFRKYKYLKLEKLLIGFLFPFSFVFLPSFLPCSLLLFLSPSHPSFPLFSLSFCKINLSSIPPFQGLSMVHQHHHHLETCYKYRFSGLTLDFLNQNSWSRAKKYVFLQTSLGFWCLLKFWNHCFNAYNRPLSYLNSVHSVIYVFSRVRL